VLERGQYIIAAVLDESVSNEPLQLHGTFIDLFDPELPVLTDKTILPGEQAFLYDVAKIKNKKTPQVLCSASRIYDESVKKQAYSFVAKSPVNTNNVVRIKLPQARLKIVVKNASGEELTDTKSAWDAVSGTCLIKFPNDPEGIYTEIAW